MLQYLMTFRVMYNMFLLLSDLVNCPVAFSARALCA